MATPDVRVWLNQMVLPDDFNVDELGDIAQRLDQTGIRAEAAVAPGSEARDIDAVTQAMFVLQFFTNHGTDLAIGVASGAFWDAIKAVAKRLRGAGQDRRGGGARIGVQYSNGDVVTVDLDDASDVQQVLRELRAAALRPND